MAQKCFCGAILETIEDGKKLRCPVEGVIYEYPGNSEEKSEKKSKGK